jgi:hypothetical protein
VQQELGLSDEDFVTIASELNAARDEAMRPGAPA